MKITGFDIYGFSLPFSKTFSVKRNLISQRKGLIIRLTSEKDTVGFGEISPLPGFSSESLKKARQQVVILRSKVLNKNIIFRNIPQLFPSVRFGLESAVFNLLTKKESAFKKSIPLIGLLQGSMKDVVCEAQKLLRQGFQNFKLKVGTENILQDIEKVQRIQIILKNQATLRLDANQFWKFADALRFAKAIEKNSIEYIEEPFKDISTQLQRVTEFFKETGIPVALDESLGGMNPKNFQSLKGLKAFILKPTILGGIEKTLQWIQRAKALKVPAVISSAFESGVGISMLAQLARSFDCLPAGLDTYKYFSKDVLIDPLKMERGNFMISARPLKEKELNFSLLRRHSTLTSG